MYLNMVYRYEIVTTDNAEITENRSPPMLEGPRTSANLAPKQIEMMEHYIQYLATPVLTLRGACRVVIIIISNGDFRRCRDRYVFFPLSYK